MVALEVCNMCGGHGFVHFFHAFGATVEDDGDTRACPSCQGTGMLEPWLQADTGFQGKWNAPSIPPWHMEEAELRAVIRNREHLG